MLLQVKRLKFEPKSNPSPCLFALGHMDLRHRHPVAVGRTASGNLCRLCTGHTHTRTPNCMRQVQVPSCCFRRLSKYPPKHATPKWKPKGGCFSNCPELSHARGSIPGLPITPVCRSGGTLPRPTRPTRRLQTWPNHPNKAPFDPPFSRPMPWTKTHVQRSFYGKTPGETAVSRNDRLKLEKDGEATRLSGPPSALCE